MKKTLLSFLLALLPIVASADVVEIDGIYYNLIPKAKIAEVSSGSEKYSGDVIIPDTVEYDGIKCTVTTINSYAFRSSDELSSLKIPKTIKSIKHMAIWLNHSIDIYISDLEAWCNIEFAERDDGVGVSSICNDYKLFLNETELVNLEIPNSIENLKNYSFSGCTSIKSLTIPNSVTSIGVETFSQSGLNSVTIPNNVVSIGDEAFRECKNLTSIAILNAEANLGKYVFSGCNSLTSLIIPNGMTSIGTAFSGCRGLTSITIPNSVTSIGANAFSNCTNLTSIVIPNSVSSIGARAFSGCTKLKTITLGSNVSEIDELAFYNCPDMIDFYCYSGNVPNTSNNAFEGSYIEFVTLHVPESAIEAYSNTAPWSGFKSIVSTTDTNNYYEMTVTVKSSLGTVTYGENSLTGGSQTYNVEEGTDVALTLTPNEGYSLASVTVDGVDKTAEVVDGVLTLTDVNADIVITVSFGKVISSDVVDIDGINYKLIPKGNIAEVTRGNYFGDVVIPEAVIYEGEKYDVISIGEDVFAEAVPITSITIPKTITKIGNKAFYYSYVKTLNINDLESWLNIEFLDEYSNPLSWVDNILLNGEKIESFVIPNGIKSIKDYAFYKCYALSSITIPNSVTSIGNYAFSGCSGLTSITVPNSVTFIGNYAFSGCSGLTTLTIPNSVTSIGNYAFQNCSGLTILTIPNSVTSIGSCAFSGCNGLTSLTIPNSVTSIGNYAFQNCSGLTILTIPNSVKSIGSYAFSGCSGIESLTIPNSVTFINNHAFYDCRNLKTIYIGSGITYTGDKAFAKCPNITNVYCYKETLTWDNGCSSLI